MLDNVIDINYYSVPQARTPTAATAQSAWADGFPGCSVQADMAYGSDERVAFADRSMEAISYYAIEASSELAAERGATPATRAHCGARASSPRLAEHLIEHAASRYIRSDKTRPWTGTAARTVQARACATPTVMAIAPQRLSPTSPAYRSRSSRRTKTCT